MAEPFSTLAAFKLHWPALPPDREQDATQKISEASIDIRAQYPDIDTRLDSGAIDAETVRLVVNRMVKRAMDIPAEEFSGVSSATAQGGPFSQTLQFTNPDGNIYLSKNDRRLLASGRPGKQAFTLYPGGVGRR